MRRADRNSRKSKIEKGDGKPSVKDKFLEIARSEEYQPNLPKFEPKSQNQRIALSYLREGRSLVFLRGSAGTGKSLCAVYHAASQLKAKKVEKIYLIRPAVSTGKSLGALPGTLEEKLAPYFAQTIAHFNTYMGKAFTGYCLRTGVIEMKGVEYLRGASLENCIVICEEVQNFSAEELEMVGTRIGDNCQMILTGDEKQNDLRGRSGLTDTVEMLLDVIEDAPEYLDNADLDCLDDNVGVVTFTPDDVVRSGLAKALVKIYFNKGN